MEWAQDTTIVSHSISVKSRVSLSLMLIRFIHDFVFYHEAKILPKISLSARAHKPGNLSVVLGLGMAETGAVEYIQF